MVAWQTAYRLSTNGKHQPKRGIRYYTYYVACTRMGRLAARHLRGEALYLRCVPLAVVSKFAIQQHVMASVHVPVALTPY
jgi:hypothetical protein